ncbi:hypothetical protein [Pseudomonas viridiflava]|uniref:hypothetical protein n=1 Tax=Pseudomonas viridiflava TaxID=33069 RepID=UPI000F019DCF|nr:hypothetical protein [Pseudomonas viridiflava]
MIQGLDKLQRDLKSAQKTFEGLDGELCTVKFDPYDPSSIERAIQTVNDTIDTKVGAYSSNPFVAPLIEGMKESYRARIIEQAAERRLAGEKE